jgi:protein ImuB
LLLDVTGEAHLFGGEALMLTELATRLGRMGFGARVAIAPTIGAAWGLARYGPHALSVVNEERITAALAPLPVAALRVGAELCAILRQVGIETVRHLLALPREKLLVRFGDELLMRMDQAFGRIGELIEPFRAAEPVKISRAFDGATTQLEAIFITVEELLGELCGTLLKKESGARGVRLELQRINMPPLMQELVLGRASRDARHLWKLLRPKVEKAHLGYGVEGVSLTAYWTALIKHQQVGAWETGADGHDEEYEAFLDTLVNRWGEKRVLAALPVASHVPELARQFQPVRTTAPPARADVSEAMVLLDRPSVLLEPPEPAEAVALQPDYPPARVVWRGKVHRMVPGRQGAERIVTAWWEEQAASTRDYFKVQTETGLWIWVFRELETGRWFVHGLWA